MVLLGDLLHLVNVRVKPLDALSLVLSYFVDGNISKDTTFLVAQRLLHDSLRGIVHSRPCRKVLCTLQNLVEVEALLIEAILDVINDALMIFLSGMLLLFLYRLKHCSLAFRCALIVGLIDRSIYSNFRGFLGNCFRFGNSWCNVAFIQKDILAVYVPVTVLLVFLVYVRDRHRRCNLLTHCLCNFSSNLVHSVYRTTDRLIVAIGLQLCQCNLSSIFIEDRLNRFAHRGWLSALIDQLHVVGILKESLKPRLQMVLFKRSQIGCFIVVVFRRSNVLLIALLPFLGLRIGRFVGVVMVIERLRNFSASSDQMEGNNYVNPVLIQCPVNQSIVGSNEGDTDIGILFSQ